MPELNPREQAAFGALFHVSCDFLEATGGRLLEADAEIAAEVGVYDVVAEVIEQHKLTPPHAFALLGTALGKAFKEAPTIEAGRLFCSKMTPEDFHAQA